VRLFRRHAYSIAVGLMVLAIAVIAVALVASAAIPV
jgi:hypothetical protein